MKPKKLIIIAVTHFVVMTILSIVSGVAALGVGFSDDKQLHFWWDLVFWFWQIFDFPIYFVLAYETTQPDLIWLYWAAQPLISLVWAFLILIVVDFTRVGGRKIRIN